MQSVLRRLRFSFVFLLFVALLLSLMIAGHGYATDKPLGVWVKELKAEAKGRGISDALLGDVFNGWKPNNRIIQLDRKQPEGTKTFTQYMQSVVPQSRVREGQQLYNKHKLLLEEIGRKYGVQPRFIVALWGIETSYGKVTGGFNVPRALATLAYDGRRAEFFRKELHNALQIIHDGHISFNNMQGSWAGAMGQSQFMPSSFLSYAVDYNGDGKRDIWHTREDIFASIANYLSKSGWNNDLTWGRLVRLPQGFDEGLEDIDGFRPLQEWKKLGITKLDGATLPDRSVDAALMFPGKPHEGAYLIYRNYPVILKWNRSRYFATAVGTLSDKIYYGR